MGTVYQVKVPQTKEKLFFQDWTYIGTAIRKNCSVTTSAAGTETVVMITVNEPSVLPVFENGVFGKKGFLTKRGWEASEC